MTANSHNIQAAIDAASTARAKHEAEHYREHLGCEFCLDRWAEEREAFLDQRQKAQAYVEAHPELALSASELLREHWGHSR